MKYVHIFRLFLVLFHYAKKNVKYGQFANIYKVLKLE